MPRQGILKSAGHSAALCNRRLINAAAYRQIRSLRVLHHASGASTRTSAVVHAGSASGQVTDIHYFPVKGLPRVALESVELQAGGCIPHDREWAVMLGSHAHEWDPANPRAVFVEKGYRGEHHGAKVKFHQLINADEMAALSIEYDCYSRRLLLFKGPPPASPQNAPSFTGNKSDKTPILDADLSTAAGIRHAETFFESLLGDKLRPSRNGTTKLKLVRAAEGITHQFANVGGTEDMLLLHLVSRSSAADLGQAAGQPVDPLRYRANILFDGIPAWEEWGWPGQHIQLGEAVLLVTEPTIRCPATQVNPVTGERDMLPPKDPPSLLNSLYPDASTTVAGEQIALGGPDARGGFMGLYARVVKRGRVNVGDAIRLLPDWPYTLSSLH